MVFFLANGVLTGERCLNIIRTEVMPKEKYYAFLERLFRKLSNGIFIEDVDFFLNVSNKVSYIPDKLRWVNEYTTLIDVRAKGDKKIGEITNELNGMLTSLIRRK